MSKQEALTKINNWASETKKAKGTKIGVGSNLSLSDYILRHGVAHRSSDRGGKKKGGGLGKFINPIREIFSQGTREDLTNPQLRKIRNLVKQGTNITGSNNPRNIEFSYNAAGKGEEARQETQYGHWYSGRYKTGQANKGKPSKADYGSKEAWSSTTPNTAKPPMWQAFFAKRNEKGLSGNEKVMSIGLFPLLEEIMEEMEEGHLDISIPSTVLGRKDAYTQIISINSVEKKIKQMLTTNAYWQKTKSIDSEGNEIDVVRIKPRNWQRALESKFSVTQNDAEAVKTLAGKKDAAGEVKEFSLPDFSATQIERLIFTFAGKNAEVKGVPIQWFNLHRSAPQFAQRNNLQKMDWRDYLRVV